MRRGPDPLVVAVAALIDAATAGYLLLLEVSWPVVAVVLAILPVWRTAAGGWGRPADR